VVIGTGLKTGHYKSRRQALRYDDIVIHGWLIVA